MSRIWLTGLPDPPEDQQWCVLCVMLAKGVINQRYENTFKTIVNDGKDGDEWVAVKLPLPLQAAKVRAIAAEFPQAGILDLCWTHAAGITAQACTPLAVADGGLPPGFIKGRG